MRGASEGEERLAFIFIQRIYSFNSWHTEQRGGRRNHRAEGRQEERYGRKEGREKDEVTSRDVTVTDATASVLLWTCFWFRL